MKKTLILALLFTGRVLGADFQAGAALAKV